jgi:hypothetical protein
MLDKNIDSHCMLIVFLVDRQCIFWGGKKPREAALREPAGTRNPPSDVPESLDVPSSLT